MLKVLLRSIRQDRIYSVTVSANDGGVGIKRITRANGKAFNEANPPASVSYRWEEIQKLTRFYSTTRNGTRNFYFLNLCTTSCTV